MRWCNTDACAAMRADRCFFQSSQCSSTVLQSKQSWSLFWPQLDETKWISCPVPHDTRIHLSSLCAGPSFPFFLQLHMVFIIYVSLSLKHETFSKLWVLDGRGESDHQKRFGKNEEWISVPHGTSLRFEVPWGPVFPTFFITRSVSWLGERPSVSSILMNAYKPFPELSWFGPVLKVGVGPLRRVQVNCAGEPAVFGGMSTRYCGHVSPLHVKNSWPSWKREKLTKFLLMKSAQNVRRRYHVICGGTLVRRRVNQIQRKL